MTDPTTPDNSTPDGLDTPAVSPEPTPAPAKRSRRRTLLIAGGAVLAAAALAGGGIAVGAAIADEDDDDDDRQTSMTADAPREDGEDAAADLSDAGTSSADELTEIVEAAAAEAEGDAVAIDAERDGAWDVQFRSDAGEEIEVRVASDGTATVISTEAADADDTAPAQSLDADTVDALVSAALAEVDGRILEIEIDDDTTSPFSVTVVAQDGGTVDIALDAEMTVVTADRD